jgi:hypothetical protein
MKLSFLPSLFKNKKVVTPSLLESPLYLEILSLQKNSNLVIFADKEIFYHTSSYALPLLVYDSYRGLYIFENKAWSFTQLKDAKISRANNLQRSPDTLAYEQTHSIIKQKFNELLHTDGVPIFNFVIMENLTAQEYAELDPSIHEFLPQERILFKDDKSAHIFKKLQNVSKEQKALPSADTILGTLFIQYTIVKNNTTLFLCNQDQIKLIDTRIKGINSLFAPNKSGKSYTILLKSIQKLFKKERQKITIIKPTLLAKEILHKRFLELVEHAIIDLDLMAFEILTPIELLNKHCIKAKLTPLDEELFIDEKLLKKSFYAADLLICDDANLLPSSFISYLKHIQKNSDLLLINEKSQERADFVFTQSYIPQNRTLTFIKSDPSKELQNLIHKLLEESKPEDILIVIQKENYEAIKTLLEDQCKLELSIIDATKHFLDQKFNSILLTSLEDTVELEAKHVIVIEPDFQAYEHLLYSCDIATESLHILYTEESQEITKLKEFYEKSQQE